MPICNKQPVTICWNFPEQRKNLQKIQVIKWKPNVRETLFDDFPEGPALGHDPSLSAYFNNIHRWLVRDRTFAIQRSASSIRAMPSEKPYVGFRSITVWVLNVSPLEKGDDRSSFPIFRDLTRYDREVEQASNRGCNNCGRYF